MIIDLTNNLYSYRISIFQISVLFFIVTTATYSHADIYRFVNIDGIETFTDAPMDKDAMLLLKGSPRKTNKKGTTQSISKHTQNKAAPSLREIIEKTVQNQISPPETERNDSIEPVLPVSGTITSPVGMRTDPIDGKFRHHNGIDIAVPTGTPVKTVASGTVVYSGLRSGYGWTVLIEHPNGMISLYGHNSQNIADAGQAVKKGDIIALAGSTGRSTGPHVHFEVWQAGANITPAFMPDSGIRISSVKVAKRMQASFRKEILADGTLLITNIR